MNSILKATTAPNAALTTVGNNQIALAEAGNPYLDYGNSYVTTAASMQPVLPRDASCVASKGLGESQRAMFEYYAGLTTRRVESDPGARTCKWLLVQRQAGKPRPLPTETNWRGVWHGARPGDDRESFDLYRATAG